MSSNLEQILQKLNKSYGQEIITMGVNENAFANIPRIPFTSPRINYMTYGGLPRNRLIEFAGEESSGKTSTALDIVGNAQRLFQEEYDRELDKYLEIGEDKLNKSQRDKYENLKAKGPKRVLYVDAENTLDLDWAELLGVQLNDMLLLYKPQQQCAEEIFQDVLELISSEEIGLCVIDSLGVLVSAQAYEKTVEERTYGGISMALTLFSKKAAAICNQFDCTLIGINQVRDNMNSPYGGVVTTGGRGWRHNCSVRMMFRKGDFVDDLGDPIKKSSEAPDGNRVLIDIVKTKSFKPDRKIGYYTLNYTEGIDAIQDVFDIAIKEEIISKAGAWYTFINPDTGEALVDENNDILKVQGKNNVLTVLDENIMVTNLVEERIKKLIEDK